MLIFTVIVVLLVVTGCYVGWSNEKKWWNNGRCPECNNVWVHFDNDSQGGRGYTCRGCGQYIWISWPVDRRPCERDTAD